MPGNCTAGTPCDPSYDDSAWRVLNVPHDFIIEGDFNEANDPNKGALPRNVSWYRKHFALPPAWSPSDSLVWLTFDGVFRAADVYVNGAFVAHHEEGYTTWHAYLHNASVPLVWGGGENVLAVFVDATQSELWCYEGGGIYRHVWLESAGLVSVSPFSFYAQSYVPLANISSPQGVDGPQTSTAALFTPRVDIQNAGGVAVNGTLSCALAEQGSGLVIGASSAPFSVPAGGWLRLSAPASLGSASAPVQLWNAARPWLYTASCALLDQTGV